MVRFEWSDDLSVGDDRIDEQHRELIENANELLMACREGLGLGKITETLGFLEGYVQKHFRDEENIQRTIAYPGYPAHKSEHDMFIKELGKLKSDLEKKGPTLALAIKTSSVVIGWLKGHFLGPDKELGKFIAFHSRQGGSGG